MSNLINTSRTNNVIASTFITNLGKYNEGYLVGEWLDLPATKEEIEKVLDKIGIDGIRYEEYFFTDWESEYIDYPGEYFNLEEYNELCERIAESHLDPEILKALTSYNYDLEQILNEEITYYYYQGDTMTEVAEYIAEEYGELARVPEDLRQFFDFEKYGRYLETGGNWIQTENGFIEVIW